MTKAASIVAVVALLGMVFMGYGYALAGHPEGRMAGDCAQSFKALDFGNDGLLNFYEWEAGQYGLGTNKGIGPAPAGNATNFYSMDTNRDNAVTAQEFCAFKLNR